MTDVFVWTWTVSSVSVQGCVCVRVCVYLCPCVCATARVCVCVSQNELFQMRFRSLTSLEGNPSPTIIRLCFTITHVIEQVQSEQKNRTKSIHRFIQSVPSELAQSAPRPRRVYQQTPWLHLHWHLESIASDNFMHSS